MSNKETPILIPEKVWMNSQLSIVRHYGQVVHETFFYW